MTYLFTPTHFHPLPVLKSKVESQSFQDSRVERHALISYWESTKITTSWNTAKKDTPCLIDTEKAAMRW